MKIKHIIIFAMLSLFIFPGLHAQETVKDSLESDIDKNDTRKNTVYFELLGNGMFYSFCYDRVIFQKNENGLSVSMGLTYFPRNSNDIWLFFPHNSGSVSPQINYFKGNKHKLELGLGYTISINYIDNPSQVVEPKFIYIHFIFARIGYRYQNPKNGLFLKGAFLPYVAVNKHGMLLLPHIGIAIGKSF